MGQRLNIEITKNGNVLANSYYHWSAYSDCALNITTKIIMEYDYIKRNLKTSHNEDLLFAIKLLEETGAGMNEEEMAIAKEKIGYDEIIKFKECKNRNEGIIAITEKEIEDTRFWEEGRVTIDVETKKINFNVLHSFDEEDVEEYKAEGNEFKEININFEEIEFENIFEIKAFVDKSNYNEQYFFKNNFNNKYIGIIE